MDGGQKRFERFRCHGGLAGGIFKHRPKSLWAFHRLVGTNFITWGIKRANVYDHGWLRFCDKKEFVSAFMGEEIEARWEKVAGSLLVRDEHQRVTKARVRRGAIKRAIQKVKRRSITAAFEALAKVVQRKATEKEKLRQAKRLVFNDQCWGIHVPGIQYTSEELDLCNTWLEVQALRGPLSTEQHKVAQIEDEKASQTRNTALARSSGWIK
jgi:hypothetical protein